MSGEYTPGPWEAHPIQRWVVPSSDPEMPVCALRYESYGIPCDEQEVRANARLIAAAPDLLEALEWAIAELDGRTRYDEDDADRQEQNCYDRARAAIARATEPGQ